jgi:hemoglobin
LKFDQNYYCSMATSNVAARDSRAARAVRGWLLALALLCLGVRAHAQTPDSLYARMGGQSVIEAVVSETIDRTAADPHLNQSFDGTNIKRIKRMLAEQICDLSGGPCHYSGDTMRQVHAGHHISEAEFYGLVQLLRSALIEHHVRLRERNELLALLAPMKRDVVEKAAPMQAAGT